MSRIDQNPIFIPTGTDMKIDGNDILVKGPKGQLQICKRHDVGVRLEAGRVVIEKAEEKTAKAMLGLTKALLANMVEGVNKGFEKKLEFKGVGYKASLTGNKLTMALGFSHPVEFEAPDGITLGVEKNVISVVGIDKYLVGQTAANIRKLKKPEPYKGKGIRYQGEVVRRKEGKKAGSA